MTSKGHGKMPPRRPCRESDSNASDAAMKHTVALLVRRITRSARAVAGSLGASARLTR
jgi:hypothetical protein